jgi:phage baseplate assembly protein W
MADKTKRLGTDLRLLRNLDIRKSSRDPGHDLATTRRSGISEVDLETLSDAENMIQALFLRFLTPAGELAVLGHPEYGSRLSDLIGELNNETNRNRAKLFVLEALAAEPRVQEVLWFALKQNNREPVS